MCRTVQIVHQACVHKLCASFQIVSPSKELLKSKMTISCSLLERLRGLEESRAKNANMSILCLSTFLVFAAYFTMGNIQV